MWKQIVKPPLSTGSSDSQRHLKSHQPERNWRPSGSWGRCKRAGREMAQSTQRSTTVQAVITNNLYRLQGSTGTVANTWGTRTLYTRRARRCACVGAQTHARTCASRSRIPVLRRRGYGSAPAPVRGFTLVPDKTP